ncbi:hypothetical protein MB02_07760 [Croceicoccus estronivorus]|uniref:SDR family oxidoreductase n=1 Tax=Croceicoccus estronivorus TaxID=1172626 RepID=UPI0008301971|nr:SDR family oxidoreductase [Croceicoccus estronivorus]OCC24158.1 hypothetical protein MB02_07760 [Croceicoccus estronivorus]
MTGKVLIAGGLGLVGRAAVEHFEALGDWDIVALSRREPDFPTQADFVSVDLSDREATLSALSRIRDVTHIVYAAVMEKPVLADGWTDAEQIAANLAMLRNLLDGLEPDNSTLRHITLLQGGKAYGAHLGPMNLPAKESDPRHMPPNFYFEQEDLLRRRQEQGAKWAWTVLRPMALIGFALGSPMNLLSAIGTYAAIARELDVPFRFTGAMHQQIGELTDTRLLARAIAWAGLSPAAANQIFNVTNGDFVVWQTLWPKLANMLDVEWAPPQPMPLSLMMADKAPVWDEIVARYGLVPHRYDAMANASWQFADGMFGYNAPPNLALLSTVKIRRAGFHDCIDSCEMFEDWISILRSRKILPSISLSAHRRHGGVSG